jgi:hypothetical protein
VIFQFAPDGNRIMAATSMATMRSAAWTRSA